MLIAAASDLHIQEATPESGAVNPLVPMNQEIVDALLWDVLEQKADVLLLCGDITNQGRLSQHEILIEKLKAARKKGLKIYVLPGNHDIGETDPTHFAALYADFGYSEAISKDKHSLSYSVRVEDMMILMLDTNGYDRDAAGAYLKPETLRWMEEQLMQAQKKGWAVLAAGHYPMITQQSTEFTGKDEAEKLFEKYGVPLCLCGHLHGMGVASQGAVTELTVTQAISYPCQYALLYAEGKTAWRYLPKKINVSAWALQNGKTAHELREFDAYQERLAREKSREVVMILKGDQKISAEKLEQAEEFYWSFSEAIAVGKLYHESRALQRHPGYDVFINLNPQSVYHWWTPSALRNAVPYTAGFILRDGKLTPWEGE